MNKHPQKLTLWKAAGLDYNNLPTFVNEGSFDVRWEQQSNLIVTDDGREIQGKGVIYFPEKVFEIGDFVAEGEHTELEPIKNSLEIKNQRSISNLSGTQWEYQALV